MTKFKKLFAAFVAVLTSLAMVTPAFAASITVNPAKDDVSEEATYTGYKILDASRGDGTAVSYTISSESPWYSVLNDQNQTWVTLTQNQGGTYNVTANETLTDDTAAAFADYLNTNKPSSATSVSFTKQSDGTFKADNIDEGYYLVTSSLGTKLILDTTKSDTINEKNDYPSLNKTEDRGNAEIGGTVTYTVSVVIPESVASKDITIYDTVTDGLTLNTFATVAGAVDSPEYNSAIFAENTSYSSNDGTKQYTITIPAATVLANKGKTLTFTYTATVNENAVVNESETNKAHLKYDNFTTNDVSVDVKTFGFELDKIAGDDAKTALNGVKFTLTRQGTGSDSSKIYYYTPGTNDEVVNEARFLENKNEVTTADGGKVTFAGLAAGTYTLTETSTLDGYKLLTSPLTITVNSDGTISVDSVTGVTDGATKATKLTVVNNTGTALPSTGGMGTTLFTVVGAGLVVAAGVLLVTRRRMQQ